MTRTATVTVADPAAIAAAKAARAAKAAEAKAAKQAAAIAAASAELAAQEAARIASDKRDESLADAHGAKLTAVESEAAARKEAARLAMMETRAAYARAIDPDLQPITLVDALAAIAGHFHEEGMVWDRQLREEVTGNKLAFLQKNILDNLCYSANSKVDYHSGRVDEHREKAAQAARQNTGDELGIQAESRALDQLDRAQDELFAARRFRIEAERMFLAVTNTRYERKTPTKTAAPARPVTDREHAMAQLAARRAAHGLKAQPVATPYVATHDGIDAAQ